MYHTSNPAAIEEVLSKSATATGRGSGSRFAILLLALALTWQNFLVQGHAHFGGDGSIVATSAATAPVAAIADKSKPAPAAPACPLCEEQALFGAYVLADAVTFVAPASVPVWYAQGQPGVLSLRTQSHFWRSRAPPLSTT